MRTREQRFALLSARLLRVILVLGVILFVVSLFLVAFAVYEVVAGTNLEWLTTSFSLSLPVEMTIAKSAYDISAGGNFQLAVLYGGLEASWDELPERFRLPFLLLIPCVFAFYIYAVYYLQKMFANFAAGKPFQHTSVRALQLVAWVLIAEFVFAQLFTLLTRWVLRRVEVSGEVSVAPPAFFDTVSAQNLAVGLTLLLIAWAFGRAAVIERERDVLQEEQSLTV